MVHASRRGREPTQRQLRVGESLRHALAELLARRELRDPALADQSITVTEVRVSPNLRHATAYVLPLGGSEVDDVLERGANCNNWVPQNDGGWCLAFPHEHRYEPVSRVFPRHHARRCARGDRSLIRFPRPEAP